MKRPHIVVGNRAVEVRACQILSLALSRAAATLSAKHREDALALPPLLLAAARAVSLATCEAPETPLEIIGLACRNTFELLLRLKHIVASEANLQQWRNESPHDQLQIYEALLSIKGTEEEKAPIREDMARVKDRTNTLGLERARRLLRVDTLATETGFAAEYQAFYRLYSKLVHPSSLVVNSPDTLSTPLYRDTLVINVQLYGWHILAELDRFEVSSDDCYRLAEAEYNRALGDSG